MSSNVGNGIREALVETLNNILSPEANVRKAAEEHIKFLEVTDEFGVHLVELTLHQSGSLIIRQLSSVLLKQYVEAHWCEMSEKFRPPVCSDSAKAKIKEMLPHGLYEPISKVRSSVAYAISAIAHWDWPEQWPDLFESLLTALKSSETVVHGEKVAVHGAMCVLTEFARDLTDIHIPHVAPLILPEMYRIFGQEEAYSIRTRGRAVEIFSQVANMIRVMSEYERGGHVRSLLLPTLPPFTRALVKGLQTPDGPTSDAGLKKDILNALTGLLKSLPKQMSAYLTDILPPVWHALTQAADAYSNTCQHSDDASGRDDEPTDSDGSVLGFEGLIFALFEFVNALVETPKHKHLIRNGLPDLIYYLIIFMQVTEEQVQTWNSNPDAFVEDEDDDSLAYSVRISAQELLKVLCEELHEVCCAALVSAVSRHLSQCATFRASGDPSWWKGHESVMLALGVSRDALMGDPFGSAGQFQISQFIDAVVIADLDPNLCSLLSGRALWCGSRFCAALSVAQLTGLLEATVAALTRGPDAILKISAVRAIWAFCDGLKSNGREATLRPYLPTVLDALMNISTQASPEVLSLVFETLSIAVSMDVTVASAAAPRISTLCLAVFIKASNDPSLVQLVQDVVRELSRSPQGAQHVRDKFVPTLTSLLLASNDKVPSSLQSVALDLAECLVRASSPPLDAALVSGVFPAVVQRTLAADDLSTVQNGGECVRAFVAVAPQQIIAFGDSEGRSGAEYVLEVSLHLLSPSTPEGTAAFVGRLICAAIRFMPDHVAGEKLDHVLRAVLSKLQYAENLVVIQSLVLVYAHLCCQMQLETLLAFLGGVPGPAGAQSALAFVLTQWCAKQNLFYGQYERKVTAMALAKLLEHGVTTNDSRLQGIIVQGDQVISEESGVRTRSQSHGAERWTRVPVLVKVFKLLICELFSAIDANIGEDDDAEDSDDDEVTPGFPSGGSSDPPDDEQDEDPDVLTDPVYSVDLQQYLTSYMCTFAQHPAYAAFVPHLNPHEREVLLGIGVQC